LIYITYNKHATSIKLNSTQPIYLQIYDSVVASIANEALTPENVLPSSRKLAKDLGINYHTVNKAYQLLEIEGFVKIDKKRVTVLQTTTKTTEEFVLRFNTIVAEIISEGRARKLDNTKLLKLFQDLLGKWCFDVYSFTGNWTYNFTNGERVK